MHTHTRRAFKDIQDKDAQNDKYSDLYKCMPKMPLFSSNRKKGKCFVF